MGVQDRDWYHEHRAAQEARSSKTRRRRASRSVFRPVAFWALVLLLSSVFFDMRNRGVPFTWHGFKWWLSLWR